MNIDVPAQITKQQLIEVCATLGLAAEHVRALRVDVTDGKLWVTLYDVNENGRHYLLGKGDDRRLAMYEISIPIVWSAA